MSFTYLIFAPYSVLFNGSRFYLSQDNTFFIFWGRGDKKQLQLYTGKVGYVQCLISWNKKILCAKTIH